MASNESSANGMASAVPVTVETPAACGNVVDHLGGGVEDRDRRVELAREQDRELTGTAADIEDAPAGFDRGPEPPGDLRRVLGREAIAEPADERCRPIKETHVGPLG